MTSSHIFRTRAAGREESRVWFAVLLFTAAFYAVDPHGVWAPTKGCHLSLLVCFQDDRRQAALVVRTSHSCEDLTHAA